MIDKSIEANLGDITYTLSPTLQAMKEINRKFGSLMEAVRCVRMADFDAICFVIGSGAGLTAKQREALETEVFESGVIDASKPAVEFIALLMNPNDDEPDEGDSGKP